MGIINLNSFGFLQGSNFFRSLHHQKTEPGKTFFSTLQGLFELKWLQDDYIR
jgi:hypothetical protein